MQKSPELRSSMRFEARQSSTDPTEWFVEAVNYNGDGEIYHALFSGPLAEERAHEYAEWKNHRQR
jgi:hypothetical protein